MRLDSAVAHRPIKTEAVPNGSYEAWLRTGGPVFIPRLEPASGRAGHTWLLQQQLLRDVGIQAARHQFGLHNLRGEFDAVVFLRDSVPPNTCPNSL